MRRTAARLDECAWIDEEGEQEKGDREVAPGLAARSPSDRHGFLLNYCSHCLVILSGTKNPVRDRDDNRKGDQPQPVLSLPGHRFLLTLAP